MKALLHPNRFHLVNWAETEKSRAQGIPRRGWFSMSGQRRRGEGKTGSRREWAVKGKARRTEGSY